MSELLTFTQGDERWKALRKRAIEDLYWFDSVVLGYGPLVPMKPDVHALMCKFVEKRTGVPALDQARFRKITVPREVGKTTCITQGYPIQRICADPNVSILICNEKEQNAKDYLAAIKWQFESNELLRALFPEVIPSDLNDTAWSASRIVVNRTSGRKEPTVFVIGVGGTVTGAHPDIVIVDDMISREAMENARAGSRTIMEQTNRWIHQLEPIVNKGATPFPEILFIGTMWWHNDCYAHIDEAYGLGEPPRRFLLRMPLETGAVQQLPMERVGDLARFTRSAIEDGKSIFPEKWSLDDLAKMRMRDPELFACSMMNNPTDEITSTFKPAWLQRLSWMDEKTFYFTSSEAKQEVRQLQDLDKIIIVDPGGFSDGPGQDRARAAVAVLGEDFKGHYFFLDCFADKATFLDAIRQIVQFAISYAPRKIYVERAGQQAAFAQLLRQELESQNCHVPVDDTTVKPGGRSKELRILEMEPYWQRGQVYVGAGPQFHEFLTQYGQFPRAARVDVLDVLGYWPSLMRKRLGTHQQRPDERRQNEMARYRARLATLRRSR